MANPTRFRWRHDGRNTDGTPFTADQFAGFELEVNGQGAVSIPAGYDADGEYEVPFTDLPAISQTGNYTLRLRVVNRAGSASAFSAPVTFAMDFRVPTAPSALAVSA